MEYAAYKYDNGVSFKVNLNNLRSLRILEGVLFSFEIMLNLLQNSRFKFTERLFYGITHSSPLFSCHLSYFEFWGSVEVLLSIVVFL